jgi:hypothetical protein
MDKLGSTGALAWDQDLPLRKQAELMLTLAGLDEAYKSTSAKLVERDAAIYDFGECEMTVIMTT